ncbi:MAG: hypothetical protein OXK21_08300 [Chloroflexota bacterium]|nr:hypothetical protein [Chloroflexota bacterium]
MAVKEVYDIAISTPFSNYDFFAHRMMELCGQMGLTYFFVNELWVTEFLEKLQNKELQVRVLLDMTAAQTDDDDPFTILAREVKRQKGYVIDDPENVAKVAHKGYFHQVLLDNKVPVPETIVVNRADFATFDVDDEVVRRVGLPFVVKPAWGDSGLGVVVDGYSKAALYKSAQEAYKSDAFLLQRYVDPQMLGNHAAWFRLYYICGQVIPCWWDPKSHEYHLVSPSQVRRYKLQDLRRIVRGIARLAKMKKFSCEICLDKDGKFYTVDYVNADPDMNPRSYYYNGVPDEVVRHIVWLLFTDAMRVVKRGQGFFDEDLAEAEGGWLEQRRLEQMARAE